MVIVARVLCDGGSTCAACQWQPVHCRLVVVCVLHVGGSLYGVCWGCLCAACCLQPVHCMLRAVHALYVVLQPVHCMLFWAHALHVVLQSVCCVLFCSQCATSCLAYCVQHAGGTLGGVLVVARVLLVGGSLHIKQNKTD